jgi:hypothetical protein
MTTELSVRILAIDPGTYKSAFIVWDRGLVECGIIPNDDLLRRLKVRDFGQVENIAVEMIASYGMAVGREVFETCVWIGRFIERAQVPVKLVFRKDIKIHLCGTTKAKDANIRQALIDKHGAPGTKKNPGKTYGITSHLWAALAVADFSITEETL